MTTLKKSLLAVSLLGSAIFAPACGDSGPPPTTEVVQLSDDEARTLCREFISKACAAGVYGDGKPECGDCHPCDQEASLASIRTECGEGITVGGVRSCIDSGFDMPTCTGAARGGCMFDVGDEICD